MPISAVQHPYVFHHVIATNHIPLTLNTPNIHHGFGAFGGWKQNDCHLTHFTRRVSSQRCRSSIFSGRWPLQFSHSIFSTRQFCQQVMPGQSQWFPSKGPERACRIPKHGPPCFINDGTQQLPQSSTSRSFLPKIHENHKGNRKKIHNISGSGFSPQNRAWISQIPDQLLDSFGFLQTSISTWICQWMGIIFSNSTSRRSDCQVMSSWR